ncbi:transketolase [Thermoplasma volcanium GSS1]|uniref:Transketolase n=1 Tax=Thermoplasma volcanium (strain ATCC 51530 / DSM 4299 / JCM 9571 / NBRC 15438 / GSS1) TaxID=273116 RepID=Q97AZ3_THEVO|nr:transketolase family protein [Thermoplasma volcanium]BAB59808.1 transketolase [Thermoplasma volcanium GSS1]
MKTESLRDTYGKELVELGRKDPDIVVLDADLSSSTKTGYFAKEFPERFFNMGISEQSMVTTAAGLAISGKKPFVSTFAIFLMRTYEQIRQSICYNDVPVRFVVTHGGITVGEDGATHQIVEDVGIMSGLPNMSVIVPSDSVETKSVIDYLENIKHPHYVRLSREKFPVINDLSYEFKIGRGYVVKDGSDATVIANGIMVSKALEAANALKDKGIDLRIINMPSVKPIDKDIIIKAARETGRIITAEEHSIYNGLGSRVSEVVSENYPVIVKRIGMRDTFGKSGKAMELFSYFHMDVKDIIDYVIQSLEEKSYENIS